MASVNMRINAVDALTPICVEVPVVLDAFADSRDQALYTLELADITPDGAVAPFVFEDAKASSLFGSVEDLVVTDLPNDTIRVRANIVIPLTVSFYDADNVLTTATSSITIADAIYRATTNGRVAAAAVGCRARRGMPSRGAWHAMGRSAPKRRGAAARGGTPVQGCVRGVTDRGPEKDFDSRARSEAARRLYLP